MPGSGPRRSAAVVYERAGERAVLLDAEGTELITLNPTGTLVWEALDGARGAEEIASGLLPLLVGVELDELTGDVRGFIEKLTALGLVEPPDAAR